MNLSNRLKAVAEIAPDQWALERDERRASWGRLRSAGDEIDSLARQAGVTDGAGIFLIVRNSLECAVALIGLLMCERPAVYVNAVQPEERRLAELRDLRPAMLVGAAADFTPEVLAVLKEVGGVGVALNENLEFEVIPEAATLGPGPFHRPDEGTALVMQTSGTTGPPKRINLSTRLVLQGMREGDRGRGGGLLPTEVKHSPALLFAPMFHASGTFGLLMSIYEARPVLVFDKFKVEVFRDAVKDYGIKFASMPPAVIQMVLDSDLTREDLSSLIAVRCGTAPLAPQAQQRFEDRFGIPVLVTYGATEFMGALARWTMDDHKAFAKTKRGSVGRVSPGVEIQIMDPETGAPVRPGEPGVLEVRGKRVGSDDWVRTNDLARLDEDHFLYILGRVDDAIMRGGFKVLAGQVAEVLARYEKVHEAAVFGVPDARLGEIPVAVVEGRPGAPPPTPEEVIEFARRHLVAYQVPVRVIVVPKLPRTVSLKISRPEARAMYDKISA
jgi:long-chain acyl-CoA synthetase